ncbi:MAG: DUF748 domain-containing protein [Desulfobacterales bacterium]|nr:DUF748 domain-containing protein [Desulfobacterales bacterium]
MVEKEAPGKKRLGWKRWTLIAATALLLVYTVIGFFIAPMVAESILPEKLSAALNRKVQIGDIAINPFRLTVAIRGLQIDETDDSPFAAVDEIFVDAELAPALAGTWTLSTLRVSAPRVHILRNRDGGFNFSDMAPKDAGQRPEAKPAPAGQPAMFRVRSLKIDSGQVVFEDRTPTVPFQTKAAPIDLSVENLTNLPGETTGYRLGLATEARERLDIQGTAAISSMRAKTDLTLADLTLEKYAVYFKEAVGFDLTAGTLALTASATFGTTTGKPDDLKLTAETQVTNLTLKDRKTGGLVIQLDRLAVEKAAVDLAATAVDVGAIQASGLRVTVAVEDDGDTSLARLAPKGEKAESAPVPTTPAKPSPWQIKLGQFVLADFSMTASGLVSAGKPAGAGDGDFLPVASLSRLAVEGVDLNLGQQSVSVRQIESEGGAIQVERDPSGRISLTRLAGNPPPAEVRSQADAQAPPSQAAPWLAGVETLRIGNWAVTAIDRVPTEPVRLNLTRIGLDVTGLSTRPENRFDLVLAMGINETGALSVKGSAGINPLVADLAVKTDAIDIRPAQSYLEDKVKILITGGRLGNEGRVTLGQTPGGETAVRYSGSAAIVELATVDRDRTRDLVKWNSLYLSDMDIATVPLKVGIGEVALTDFFARLIVNEDGSLNLTRVMAQEKETEATPDPVKTPQPATPPDPATTGPEIHIGTVTLQGGRVRFSDRQIQPHFETEFMDLGGSVSGLSSENLARADVLLKGRLDNHAPLEITGKINPLIQDRYTDIKIAFSDIEMSPFTPYSGKYLGYVLDKGKLSLDLTYRVSKGELVAENRVRFDQLTLGKAVESPDATSLPIGLALSLLEDRNGVIDLDLPLRGNLDDPEFSIGGIVLKMLVNLVRKIITAPFAALGSIFGGGEEMSQVDFAAGTVDLGEEPRQQLDKLSEALYQRPGLKLDIQGEVSPETDREGLRRQRFDGLLVASKIQDRARKKLPVVPRKEMAVSPDEYDTYLAAAYAAADFPKPREADGRIKQLPPEEMEKLLYTQIAVTDNDLRQMAAERAARVKDYLLETGKMAPERVFLKEPAPVAAEGVKETEERKSRVVFTLK